MMAENGDRTLILKSDSTLFGTGPALEQRSTAA